MRSIGFKLTIIMLSVILLGILATTGVSMLISGNVIMSESLEKVLKDTENQTGGIDSWLSYQKSSMATLAATLSQTDDMSREQIALICEAVMDANEPFFDVFLGYPDGTATTGSGYVFDYSTWTSYERGWYKLALTDMSKAHITTPYIDAQTGELCITAVHAVVKDRELIGVIAADIFVSDLLEIIMSIDLGSSGYAMLLDSNGDILVHPDSDYAPVGEDYRNIAKVKDNIYSDLWNQILLKDGAVSFKDSNDVAKYYTACTLSAVDWKMVTILPKSVVTKPITNLIFLVIPITLTVLAVSALLVRMFVKNITGPLIHLTAFMKKASSTGDISLTDEDKQIVGRASKTKDELGQCISASADFVARIAEVSDVLKVTANGDLTANISLLSERDEMGSSLQTMLSSLNSLFGNINDSTEQVSTGSRQIADSAQALASGSTEQAASVEELTATVSDISEKTKQNAVMAGKASELAKTIKQKAEKGNSQMNEMMAAVSEINQASQSINKVIKVIDDIAFQTNILALNAAVEAARAGDAGKGFAVVAEEVRNLAGKSAEAAKDTGSLIVNSIEKAEVGTRIAQETAASLAEIVDGINESSKVVAQIASSSEEQSVAVSQINNGLNQVTLVIQQNSATAEESAAASEHMSSQSNLLEELVRRFKLKGK
ncbi:MAG: methyl-accepting chemotaxis protein [Oscillospiraceae bacterium]|nr:methyl-accepting chemotaxis protein [Oscillospiraceae bacterium]